MNGMNQPSRETQVATALHRLDGEVESLSISLIEVEKRFSPLLRPEEITKEECLKNVETPVPFVAGLNNVINKVRGINDRLLLILTRCEL